MRGQEPPAKVSQNRDRATNDILRVGNVLRTRHLPSADDQNFLLRGSMQNSEPIEHLEATGGWAEQLKVLHGALKELDAPASALGVPHPHGQEWYELLVHKLLPQAETQPWLVVAVVGGTNIGKSVVFNHLAGEAASSASPLAAGTRHPVCLVPEAFADGERLATLFDGFELSQWHSSDDPLSDAPENKLFWRASSSVPPRLMLLDTPDIDSDVQVNWERADAIRQAADVLIAVLTQQKYNDAAVKQFFRQAAAADKAVIVVFNQVDLREDREYWPQWLATFADETGIQPELVYVVPSDREAVGTLSLPFHTVGRDGKSPPSEPSSLSDELAALHFDAIKLRTLRGALRRVIDPGEGVPAYLRNIRQASDDFGAALSVLQSANVSKVDWPSLPPRILVNEISQWWNERRSGWSRSIHGAYRTVWDGVTWPIRKGWQAMNPPAPDVMEQFHNQEREAIAKSVERLLAELDRLATVGNDTLRPRMQALLGGEARTQLLDTLRARHEQLPPIGDDYRKYLRTELEAWVTEHPKSARWLQSADHVAAIARPAMSVTLFFGGMMMIDGVAAQAAGQAATHLATEVTVASGITGGGDAVVAASGSGVARAAGRLFGNLQRGYAELRVRWFYETLQEVLLGDVMTELQHGAEIPGSAAFLEIERVLVELEALANKSLTTDGV